MDSTLRKFFLVALIFSSAYSATYEQNTVDDDESNQILGNPQEAATPRATTETGSTDERDRLLNSLFQNYNKDNYPNNVVLKFGVSVIRFDVDDFKNNLELDLWLRQTWSDSRFTWNPEDYGGHTVIRVSSDNVWKPDVALYNSAADPDRVYCSSSNVLIYSDGKVLWVPACHVKAYCNLTLDHAPYGEQSCTLKYGSWTFDGYSVDLQFYDTPKADLSDLWDISDWEITDNSATRVEKYYACCKEPYPYLGYEFKFQRKGNTGGANCSK